MKKSVNSLLGGLLTYGEFIVCPSSDEIKSQWHLECDQVAQFVLECCELNPEAKAPSQDVYKAYQGFARNAGFSRVIQRNRLTTRLRRFGVIRDKGGNGKRFLVGIRLKS